MKILKPKVFVSIWMDPGLPYKSHQILNSTKSKTKQEEKSSCGTRFQQELYFEC